MMLFPFRGVEQIIGQDEAVVQGYRSTIVQLGVDGPFDKVWFAQ
jgi:hypothetical protein